MKNQNPTIDPQAVLANKAAVTSKLHGSIAMKIVGTAGFLSKEIRMEILTILLQIPLQSLQKTMVQCIIEQFISVTREYFEFKTLDNALRIAKALDYKLPAPSKLRNWARSSGLRFTMDQLRLNPTEFYINGGGVGLKATLNFLAAVKEKMPSEASQPQSVAKAPVVTKVAQAPKVEVKNPQVQPQNRVEKFYSRYGVKPAATTPQVANPPRGGANKVKTAKVCKEKNEKQPRAK